MATPKSIKAQLAEYEYLIKLQMAKIQELAEENEKLRSGLGAHGVLKLMYSDETVSQTNRIKAAGLALAHETPKLQPVPPSLELTAEPVVPLATLVEQRRARQDRMEREAKEAMEREAKEAKAIEVKPDPQSSVWMPSRKQQQWQ
jgi:hypothetical protein